MTKMKKEKREKKESWPPPDSRKALISCASGGEEDEEVDEHACKAPEIGDDGAFIFEYFREWKADGDTTEYGPHGELKVTESPGVYPPDEYFYKLTVNVWLKLLLGGMCKVALTTASFFSNLNVCIALSSDVFYQRVPKQLRFLYIGSFVIASILWVCLSVHSAWRTKYEIHKDRSLNWWQAFAAKVMIRMTDFPKLVGRMPEYLADQREIQCQTIPQRIRWPDHEELVRGSLYQCTLHKSSRLEFHYELQSGTLPKIPLCVNHILGTILIIYFSVAETGLTLSFAVKLVFALMSLCLETHTLSTNFWEKRKFKEYLSTKSNDSSFKIEHRHSAEIRLKRSFGSNSFLA